MGTTSTRHGASLTVLKVCCSALLVAYAASGWVRADEVVLVTGSSFKTAAGATIRGQVESESPTEVVVRPGNNPNPITVPTDQIASIRYSSQSPNLILGETRESSGQLAEAAEYFRKAAGESAEKPFVLQTALFREASVLADLALVEPERMKDAKDRLRRFVQAYPNSRHIVSAREDLARIQLNSGDFSGAEGTIADLARIPRAAERAAVLHAKVLGKQSRFDEAVSELDRLIRSLPEKSKALRDARLVKAEALVGAKKFTDAEALVRQVIAESPAEDAALQSVAYNTLGDCLRAANHPKEALLAYLHTDLLYSKDKVEHPRALAQIERLFRLLKQDGRADEYAQRLKQDYPRSQWLSAK